MTACDVYQIMLPINYSEFKGREGFLQSMLIAAQHNNLEYLERSAHEVAWQISYAVSELHNPFREETVDEVYHRELDKLNELTLRYYDVTVSLLSLLIKESEFKINWVSLIGGTPLVTCEKYNR